MKEVEILEKILVYISAGTGVIAAAASLISARDSRKEGKHRKKKRYRRGKRQQ